MMPEVRRNQNFACGDCKRQMEEGEIYFVVDQIGYCIQCADHQENTTEPTVMTKEDISVLKDIGAELKYPRMEVVLAALKEISEKHPDILKIEMV